MAPISATVGERRETRLSYERYTWRFEMLWPGDEEAFLEFAEWAEQNEVFFHRSKHGAAFIHVHGSFYDERVVFEFKMRWC